MEVFTGHDLLEAFKDLNIDLRTLNPNVIKAWFDTDCKSTKNLLNLMCYSLSKANYVSPLEQAEYANLKEHLETKVCEKYLTNLDPEYLSILHPEENMEEIMFIEDEIEVLEENLQTLDIHLKFYENLDSNLNQEITLKTSKEIQTKTECEKSQEACILQCEKLDETNKKLQGRLMKYEPDAHFVNFVNLKEYQENTENLNSFIMPLMEIDQTCLESSDDRLSDSLETCRRRILNSHQIFLVNKVELEKLKEIYEFLNTPDVLEKKNMSGENSQMNIKAKEMYKIKLCEVLNDMSVKLADQYLKQTRLRYVQKELEDYRMRSENISIILKSVQNFLCYYILTIYLLIEEKRHIDCITTFYQKMVKYIHEDLYKCSQRNSAMTKIIEDYKLYASGPDYDKMKLIKSIGNILSSNGNSLKSTLEAVSRFKTELDDLESQVFCNDLKNGKKSTKQINEDIKILKDFLVSGPTERIVLIPIELQEVWFEIDEYFKKESDSILEAINVPQVARRAATQAQKYMKQLWISFLTNPSKVEIILKQAEADFNKRTAQ